MNPKRIALWFLIVSVSLSAIVGIIAIVAGTFGQTQAKILLTTLTISGASICAMACGALWESRQSRFVPVAGISVAIITACLVIVGIWVELRHSAYWRFSASVGLVAIATAHACLISLARLAPRFVWSRTAAFIAAYMLAALFIYIIYFTPKGDTWIRVIGVTSIILAALTILTPVFHRLSRTDLSESAVTTGPIHATITCPGCGASLPNSPAEIKCDHCGCTFIVTILDRSRLAGQAVPS